MGRSSVIRHGTARPPVAAPVKTGALRLTEAGPCSVVIARPAASNMAGRPGTGGAAMPKTMRAAVLRKLKTPLKIEAVAMPEPKPGEVLIKVAACGVCHSDVHAV